MFDQLSDKFASAFKHLSGNAYLTEKNIDVTVAEIKEALLTADVHYLVVKDFCEKVKTKALGVKVAQGVSPGEEFVKIVHDELVLVLGGTTNQWQPKKGKQIILMVGTNGVGKTTSCAKLALFLRKKWQLRPYLVPADTYRPAAKEQLMVLAKNIQVPCYDSDLGQSVPRLVLNAVKELYLKDDIDVIIIDTAGRLQVDQALMSEIAHIKENLVNHDYPLETLLVADAMMGQESVSIAKKFHEACHVEGLILTKMDSDARGGAALSMMSSIKVPIYFMGTGESVKDFSLFQADRLAGRILDMGDILSLVEKAHEVVDEKSSEKILHKIQNNTFDLNDFLAQMEAVQKMGPLQGLLKMIPGMGNAMKQLGDLSGVEDELKRVKAMVNSMTKNERKDYLPIKQSSSRQKRVAAGSGLKEGEIKSFLKKFEDMRSMMTQFAPMMKGQAQATQFSPSNSMGEIKNHPNRPIRPKKKGPWGGFSI